MINERRLEESSEDIALNALGPHPAEIWSRVKQNKRDSQENKIIANKRLVLGLSTDIICLKL